MIDFHSHILPGVDDGSKDTKESLALLDMLYCQGVDAVVATPHYNAENETPAEFAARRNEAFESLKCLLTENHPRIILGAEVAYYEGVSRLEGLEKLCIENTNILLLEMPMSRWTDYVLKELRVLSSAKGLTILLAHIERYMAFQSSSVWKELRKLGILTQVNASFFNRFLSRGKAVSMLSKGEINAVGSDCHNLSQRPPAMGEAADVIRRKLGENFLLDFTEYHNSLLFDDIG